MQYAHLDHTQNTVFYLGKFLVKLADDECRSKAVSSMSNIMYIQPFSMEVNVGVEGGGG